MSKPTENETSDPAEDVEETWDKCVVSSDEIEVVRTPGSHRYRLKYRDINGERYEQIIFKARKEETEKVSYNELISRFLRHEIILAIAGKEYKDTTRDKMDREMSPWMREDIERFVAEYIQGEL